jgi:lipoate-protein ligase A
MVTEEKSWRMLDVSYDSAAMNLALEEALARTAGSRGPSPTARFWVNPRAVVIGRFQQASAEVDIAQCNQTGVEVVRRFTGGGGVFHDEGTLNFTVTTNRSETLSLSSLQEGNLRIVQNALKSLGVDSWTSDPNSLVVNGRKVCGAAAALGERFAFWHCSILVSTDTKLLETLLAPSRRALTTQFVRSIWKPVMTIAEAVSKPVTIGDMKSSLIRSVENLFEVRLDEEGLSTEEKDHSKELFAEKYSSDDWNLYGKRRVVGR